MHTSEAIAPNTKKHHRIHPINEDQPSPKNHTILTLSNHDDGNYHAASNRRTSSQTSNASSTIDIRATDVIKRITSPSGTMSNTDEILPQTFFRRMSNSFSINPLISTTPSTILPAIHDINSSQVIDESEDDQMKQLANELQLKIVLETTDNDDHDDDDDDENDSDYEDIEEDQVDQKSTKDDDISIKPRSLNKKDRETVQSEDSADENDNQNVPTIQPTKPKELLDDDNNTQSPAYIPRKGKFYEHDDRTLDASHRSKQEVSRNQHRFFRDSDAKWQHDLFFQDQKVVKSRQSQRNFQHREQFQLNDYISSRPHKPRQSHPTNKFDFNDYNRSKVSPLTSRQTKGDYHQQQHQIDDRIFHRRRNFTNSQFQQHESTSRNMQSNLPPRLQYNQNQSNNDRPKRYSNMRTNLNHQQRSLTQLSNSKTNEQNEWPQAPPPPTSYLPQQLITPQMFYQQQTSRYVPLNYSQTSIAEQFQTSK